MKRSAIASLVLGALVCVISMGFGVTFAKSIGLGGVMGTVFLTLSWLEKSLAKKL
ncbi:MAG: hypothetical protein UU11_C0005G0054 [Parcubacteria group bacterium GW2011_GWF2_40_69]|nr:MAG: hypothetical protein UT25_C0001G0154 [Parcubacteria group bacterium GW2011_GWC1_39_12]KKR19678.1 MAG: hypothetical protein UT49_C0001G0154 [Parcubacteria group bacterium GW2011_GWF1_39_37]KKR35834.1 MAG: hypothetical protein UT68_C0001G0157 [Parcubacteria group bacterium GW2011_GWC2_40_10]KKR52646.1 MAG: hypothetical protein UT89_C0001G0154 [Parcubacteria group bacterium GW2011_GWE1_40_20]KKR65665.1 MAG: hypothetical protein UU06_C0013G0011 [Parcubacteria group bacterium GW2011_GWB1_40_